MARILLLLELLVPRDVMAAIPSDQIGPDFIRQTVESVAELVRENYFDPRRAVEIADTIRRRAANGAYDDLKTVKSLSDRLTGDLFELTRDKHLVVAARLPIDFPTQSTKSDDSARFISGQAENFGVQKVEILNGNVGYLNLTSFYPPEEAGDAIAAAMQLLRNADALIVDLRAHAGGSPDTTVLFASYFLEKPSMPLFRIVDRAGNARAYTTSPNAPEDQNCLRPTFLLTSNETFSAGEGIAFLLQEHGRAKVVGEKTAGAANPGRPYDVNTMLEITIPNGKIVSAVNSSNWEGNGVTPDVGVSASHALPAAHRLALSELIHKTSDSKRREHLEQRRDEVHSAGALVQSPDAQVNLQEKINECDGATVIFVRGGEFWMGSDEAELDHTWETLGWDKAELEFTKSEQPKHLVKIGDFWIYRDLVTVAQYRRFCEATRGTMPTEPTYGWKNENPIVNVSWQDAKLYCEWAGCRLPYEAEWEYAARGNNTGVGGTKRTVFVWGDKLPDVPVANLADETFLKSGYYDNPNFQIFRGYHDGHATASPVDAFAANSAGLRDMAGNVLEWCEDWFDSNYYTVSPTDNPHGPTTGTKRVLRGGAFDTIPTITRISRRLSNDPDIRNEEKGFRCVCRERP